MFPFFLPPPLLPLSLPFSVCAYIHHRRLSWRGGRGTKCVIYRSERHREKRKERKEGETFYYPRGLSPPGPSRKRLLLKIKRGRVRVLDTVMTRGWMGKVRLGTSDQFLLRPFPIPPTPTFPLAVQHYTLSHLGTGGKGGKFPVGPEICPGKEGGGGAEYDRIGGEEKRRGRGK